MGWEGISLSQLGALSVELGKRRGKIEMPSLSGARLLALSGEGWLDFVE